MSDDEADPELLALLRKSLGLGGGPVNPRAAETKVLENAQFVFDNAIDVALNPCNVKAAAESIWRQMLKKGYSTQTWSQHKLHPKSKDEATVDFVFTMDLLNFSFWSELSHDKRFAIEYRGTKWTGYWSLVAALQRALDEEIPITTPKFWTNEDECNEALLKHVFRSATEEEIPLLKERLQCLREAGRVLCKGKRVRLYKRAQILIADLWACFNGESFGEFYDIDKITMFADYRIPQMLHQLGCLRYSPSLETHIRKQKIIPSGSTWEVELRATSIWCVELIRREIERQHPETKTMLVTASAPANGNSSNPSQHLGTLQDEKQKCSTQKHHPEKGVQEPSGPGFNAILIDFFLYDTVKELESDGAESIPHHRTRSIWY
ncbi:hypothetical protein EYZ11_001859 [Aspergillus tanneri]|uniref:Queuosine 5'-phosphate N-glycosylase/hydrolase n=1 Tax=Aspergillus tanneri TaxID=1220188 RepID=A0A4S3JSF1_9EURO|nr:hypothetical protein EYZ11_001859 [Aspergillus tanneri]